MATPLDANVAIATLLGRMPRADQRDNNHDVDVADTTPNVYTQEVRDLLQLVSLEARGKLGTQVPKWDGADLVTDDGTSGSTIALYRINIARGKSLCGNVFKEWAAQADVVLIGAGQWDKSLQLDGSAAVVLTADGKTYDVALVQVLIAGVPTLYAIFGDEADDASEVAPDTAGIKAALAAADITDHDASVGGVVARFKIQREAVDTITMTHVDPSGTTAAELALAAERLQGTLHGLVIEVADA